ETDPAREAAWREVQAMLDEEIQRLPETYRAPFLLCILEGQSRAQAAAGLGVTQRILEKRLARARALLQGRLARRGVSLGAVLATAAITSAAGPVVPRGLLCSTANALTVQASGGALPAKVAALLKRGENNHVAEQDQSHRPLCIR